jgi:CHAD domain-containing protein
MAASSFTLLPLATINGRVRKILKELDVLLQITAPTPEEIHKLRRSTKKLRAWLRLVNGSKKADHLLRNSARRFSTQRDTHVRQQTLQQLPLLAGINPKIAATHVFSASLQGLQDSAHVHPSAPDERELAKLGKLLNKLKPELRSEKDSILLHKGLRTAWRRAARLLKKISVEHSVDDVHRFRRRVKYLCYQLELVVQRKNGETRTLHKRLEQLGAELGNFHDLDVLQHCLRELDAGVDLSADLKEELTQANLFCEQGKARLLQSSLELADKCFERGSFRF